VLREKSALDIGSCHLAGLHRCDGAESHESTLADSWGGCGGGWVSDLSMSTGTESCFDLGDVPRRVQLLLDDHFAGDWSFGDGGTMDWMVSPHLFHLC
jgi:hypothetical protein